MIMGYRSEVAILVYGEPYAFDKHYQEYFSPEVIEAKEIEWVMPKTVIRTEVFEGKPRLMFKFHADYIKWYVPEYKDVTHLDNFWRTAAEAGLNVEFMRIGEEYDDIDTESYGDEQRYYLGFNRSIEMDAGLFEAVSQ
jgi:hypothetical protein